jgi:hypothetical protein
VAVLAPVNRPFGGLRRGGPEAPDPNAGTSHGAFRGSLLSSLAAMSAEAWRYGRFEPDFKGLNPITPAAPRPASKREALSMGAPVRSQSQAVNFLADRRATEPQAPPSPRGPASAKKDAGERRTS